MPATGNRHGMCTIPAELKIMKLIIAIFTAFIATVATAQTIPGKMIGKWEAVGSDNQGIGLEIRDSSEIYVVYGIEKKKVSAYRADFSVAPGWFDFTIKDSQNVVRLKSLLTFVNDDLMQWQLFDGPTRPEHFTDKEGEMVYLRRKK